MLTFDKRAKVVVIAGLPESITSAEAVNLKHEFTRLNLEGYRNIIVDMKNTASIDASGLSAILVLKRLCLEAKGVHVLINVPPHVHKLIHISQIEHMLNIKSNLKQALDLCLK